NERVVDDRIAQLHRNVEELGDQEVLPFGRQLDEAEGRRARQPAVADEAKGVVLLLDEAAHGVERLLVLQPSVQELAPELVPPVRSEVRLRVELAEQVLARGA